jgi:hypothetical protein
MATREYPNPIETIVLSTLVEVASLDGGASTDSASMTPIDSIFRGGSIFDGGGA